MQTGDHVFTAVRDRARLVRELEHQGIWDARVLEAMGSVPREHFVPEHLVEFAYQNSPLPISEGQTISQPFVVAAMAQAMRLEGSERVLEVGTGSGYAAAVLSHLAREVYTIERHATLAEEATDRLRQLNYENVHVLHGDGTLGWPEQAPFDGIVVAAGGPEVPEALRQQLAVDGRIVIPVGPTPRSQELVVERLREDGELERYSLGGVRFVPLIGEEGWEPEGSDQRSPAGPRMPSASSTDSATKAILDAAEPFGSPDWREMGPVVERLSDARIVLLGEASHGTSEFYRIRAELTKALILQGRVQFVAIEGDWPDAATADAYVRLRETPPPDFQPFARFPTWMWRNTDVRSFLDWLRAHNETLEPEQRVGFFGLDVYSLYLSIAAVLEFLDRVDPEAARVARKRYGCLSPWQTDPQAYGWSAATRGFESCEPAVVKVLEDLLAARVARAIEVDFPLFDATQNARVVANAERYYRSMYRGPNVSWNLRDSHMFETLEALLDGYGDHCGAVIWEHNSHVGDARATEMGARGDLNVGQLCRERFGDDCRILGFGTHQGTVAAAKEWGGPMEVMDVTPSHPQSYEQLYHGTDIPAFMTPLDLHDDLVNELAPPRLERAIGVVYRPETELASHYFQAVLPVQFDEYAWVDESSAVRPLT